MSRVLLCGAFGQENPGDDALLHAFEHALSGHKIVIASGAPLPLPGRETVDPRPRAVADALRRVDAVVVAGGTVFKSLHPTVPRHHLGLLARTRLLAAGAHARGVPFALVGVGAGALRSRTAARLARSIADGADLLVLRDEESATVLDGIGATGPFRIGADPAWSLPGLVREPTAVPERRVLVALSHLASDDRSTLADRIADIVGTLASSDVEVRLQPWQSDDGPDLDLARAVTARLDTGVCVEVVDRPRSLYDAVDRCRDVAAVVGLRHHALVAAGAAGRPFLALAHEPKLAGLARRLGQPWIPAHAPRAALARSASTLLDHPAPARSTVQREVATAETAMQLLRVVVAGGDDDHLLDRDRLALTADGAPW